DLQEMYWRGARGIELTMAHARARAHPLNIARTDRGAVTDRVLVRELTAQHVADNFHVPVCVRAKSRTGLDAILIDHAQWTEFHVPRVVVIRERERVEGLEPAVIGIAPLVTASNLA